MRSPTCCPPMNDGVVRCYPRSLSATAMPMVPPIATPARAQPTKSFRMLSFPFPPEVRPLGGGQITAQYEYWQLVLPDRGTSSGQRLPAHFSVPGRMTEQDNTPARRALPRVVQRRRPRRDGDVLADDAVAHITGPDGEPLVLNRASAYTAALEAMHLGDVDYSRDADPGTSDGG